MLQDTSVAPIRSSGVSPVDGVVAVADPEPLDQESVLLGPRLLREGRVGRDRARTRGPRSP